MSIALLLCGHFGLFPPMGRLGVECFFVLSGRLMAEILFVRETPLKVFYLRRFSRIYPAIAVFVASMLLATHLWPDIGMSWRQALLALTFTQNYQGVSAPGPIAHIWSLCVEEHSYLILSAIAFWRRQVDPKKALLALALICMAIGAYRTWWLGKEYFAVYWRTDARAASVFISAALYLILKDRPLPRLAAPLACAAGFAILIGPAPDPIKYSIGTTLLALSVSQIDLSSGVLARFLSTPAMTALGLVSYSLYLWQQPFSFLQPAWAMLPGVFVLSLTSFYIIEAPARKWLNKTLTRA